MRPGWDSRRRLRRAASVLVAFTLLPVAVLVVSAHGTSRLAASSPPSLRMQDIDLPTTDALKRSEASDLFAPFAWDGQRVSGPFVQFDYSPWLGDISRYSALDGSNASRLVDAIQFLNFSSAATPLVSGPTFVASGKEVSVLVHDEPMALLEVRSGAQPQTVVVRFPMGTTDIEVSHAMTWPRSTLAFTIGGNHGRLILGKGTLTANGTNATAKLETGDYLALRAVPSFAKNAAERNAVLDAFASGRLAGEYDLVAMSSGGWIENSAQYLPGLVASSSSVQFSRALINLGMVKPQAGLILLAFDPRTMPADSSHHLVVTGTGAEIPETRNPLESLYATPGASDHASFVRLAMNATVLVVYLPNLTATPLKIESVVVPALGIDWSTELAMVAALFVVSVAAAVMLRRPQK